ncbi:MarR family winged helix-turn-helix transcriptional regulator [Leifsonia aquatica]|uniref:MarR family winged helix-turn-helix transcriptional regulator n=1 Tax=Leifsonia aquatica TaxID=144185 RepID=UPI0028AF3314|nr:MarR family transcriptional regulator [Leifsonia aquatica]
MATQDVADAEARLAFFSDLVRCETRLYNQFDNELRKAHGIVTSQYEFLRYLRDHESPRTTDIAADMAIGVGAVSKAMDRLEVRGLIVRTPNPANRRSTILALTEEGRALLAGADVTFQARLTDILLSAATTEELAATVNVLQQLRLTLEKDGLGTPAG